MEKRFLNSLMKANSIDEKNYTIDFIMTIEEKDRHGDIVDVDSIKLTNFMNNPVVLPSHDHSAMAVAKVTETWVEMIGGKKALIGKVKFAVEEYELGKTYWNLYKNGFMSAVSIGFIPERGEMMEDGFVLYGSEILELSFVSIPANQLALAKAKGIDVTPITSSAFYLKELRELFIATKELIGDEKETVETKEPEATETVVTEPNDESTTQELPDEAELKAIEQKIAKQRALKILNKAIRALR